MSESASKSGMHPGTQSIAARIESGDYYKEARYWYSELFHTPISQRCYYIFVIMLATINAYFAVQSFLGVFPLVVPAPFVTYSDDVMEDIPHISLISEIRREDKNTAVMKYMIKSYVINRESYSLSQFELRYRNIWSQSTQPVFEQFKKEMDANNPYSFYRMYTNRSKRTVDILSVSYRRGKRGETSHARVIFEAPVILLASGRETSVSKWAADFDYKYTNFWVDQSLDSDNLIARFFGLTGGSVRASGERRKVVPMTFIVSKYTVRELLE